MKNKKVVIILTSMIVLIGGIFLVNKIYNKPKNKHIPKKNNLAIMIKNESGEYVSTDAIPKGNYVLNEEKTICENGGKVVSYDNSTGQIGFSFLGSDRCSLYFDKIIDTEKPVISNLTVNGTTITATFTDNIELSGYGISTSNSAEPTSWTSISGTTYNLSTSVNNAGTYYLWVKDSSDNKTVKEFKIGTSLAEYIIKLYSDKNAIDERTTFSTIYTDTNDKLFKTNNTEDGSYVYYYAGNTSHNWVKFANFYWQIIRTNENGSVRLLYVGSSHNTTSGYIGKSKINNLTTENPMNVGYMYGTSGSLLANRQNTNSSTVKQTLDSWYLTNVYNKGYYKYIDKAAIYCNDRSTNGTYGTNKNANFSYGPKVRLSDGASPSYKCGASTNGGYIESSQAVEDKFSSDTTFGGNGKLKCYGNNTKDCPIGLITSDEAVMAGGVAHKGASVWYSVNSEGNPVTNLNWWWTMSPYYFYGGYGDGAEVENYVIAADYSNSIFGNATASEYYIRPVLSLSKCAIYDSGDGTPSNPYVIKDGGC